MASNILTVGSGTLEEDFTRVNRMFSEQRQQRDEALVRALPKMAAAYHAALIEGGTRAESADHLTAAYQRDILGKVGVECLLAVSEDGVSDALR